VDVHAKLDELTALIDNARAMPMSASCVVNRGEVLAYIDEIRGLLPAEFDEAQRVLDDKGAVIAEGHAEAARIVEAAKAERTRLIARAEIMRDASKEAEELRATAVADAERMRLEIQHRKKHSPVKAVAGVTAVLVLIGGGVGYKMYSDHQHEMAVARAEKERVEAEARKAKAELEAALANLKKETDSRLALADEKQKAAIRAEYEARKAALEGRSAPKVHKAAVVEEPKAVTVPTMQKRKISDNPLDGLDLDEAPSSSKKKK